MAGGGARASADSPAADKPTGVAKYLFTIIASARNIPGTEVGEDFTRPRCSLFYVHRYMSVVRSEFDVSMDDNACHPKITLSEN